MVATGTELGVVAGPLDILCLTGASVRENIIEETIHSLLNEVSRRELHLLLSRDEEWEQFVTDAELTRDESEAVREGLKKHGKLTAMEVKEMHQEEKEFREKFLRLYSQVKGDVEEHIKQLHALAEKADEVHKNCTIANVVADSTGIVSSILCIAAIGLAPFTGGLSLVVSGTGLAIGSAATVTAVTSSIVEHSYMSSIEAEAKNLESTGNNLHLLWKVLGDSKERISSLVNNFKVVRQIAKHVRAIRLAKLGPKAQSSNLFSKVFEGAARTMTEGSRIIGGVATGLAILVDVYCLVQDSKDLHEGGKSQSGAMLRQRAQELENMLVGLQQFYEKLQESVKDTILYSPKRVNQKGLHHRLREDGGGKQFYADTESIKQQ
ncbi:apolipoprotein L2-like [Sorex araneus]|uniref:apolipoprotein L2-like n=1 Tax=Sorex araneus TaxID=42254 RepID=UPI002433BFF4|nr:apolipoprotein L2-like [Sorex araneus]